MRAAPSKNVARSSSSPPHCRGCTARKTSASVSQPITSWEIIPCCSTSVARSRIAGSCASIRSRKASVSVAVGLRGCRAADMAVPSYVDWPAESSTAPHSTRRPRASRPIGAFAEQAQTTRARAVRGNIITRPGLTAGFDPTASATTRLYRTVHLMPMRGASATGALASFDQRARASRALSTSRAAPASV